MRWSKAHIPTLREDPSEAEVTSHKLMLRAGLMRKLASGTYSYLPLGLRVLRKIEQIIREEMDKKGALEVLLPALQPSELWKKSGRHEALGKDMVSFTDRHGREIVLGPTHEEVITELVGKDVSSYRQLPLTFYQIQTKFRDEPRPRFGVIRSKEFIMKDAYSFNTDQEDLDRSYRDMYEAYCAIFKRCGLDYAVVEADTGFMGGKVSHEFLAVSEGGEDRVIVCRQCGWTSTPSRAACTARQVTQEDDAGLPMREVDTPDAKTIPVVSKMLNVPPWKLVKTLLYKSPKGIVAALVRGDDGISEEKLLKAVGEPGMEMADAQTVESATGAPVGFAGPVGLEGVRIICDNEVMKLKSFATGANKADRHIINVVAGRDFKPGAVCDIRDVSEGDLCARCGRGIEVKTAIELGHIFKLGTKYTDVFNVSYLDENSQQRKVLMGCYGIGVNRIMAACIEANHDSNGIKWPLSIAPYSVIVQPLEVVNNALMDCASKLYSGLIAEGVEAVIDDRDERPGVKFKDADLVGFPVRVTVGERNFKKSLVEIRTRKDGNTQIVSIDDAAGCIHGLLKNVQSGVL